MSFTLISIRDILILVLALTIDTFAVSFFYGSSKIKIPFLSVIIINAICSSILAVSLLLGYLLRTIIPENVTKWACFFILFLLGIFKLCDSYLKIFMQKHADLSKNFLVSFSGICFALSIYADPEKADIDSSHDISPVESISLAIALSLDSLAAGFGAALTDINIFSVILTSFIIGILAIKVGGFLGESLAKKSKHNFSWISGVALIILAFLKL